MNISAHYDGLEVVVKGNHQETLNLCVILCGTRQQGMPVIFKDLILPDKFDPESTSFAVRNNTTELFEP